MTREEAKGNLIHAIRWNDMPKKEALEMAIKALEQEPCDAISRQAVNEIINDIRDCISVEGYWAILERTKNLPSVNPQPCDDAMNRILKRMWNCRGKHTTSIDKVKMELILRDELPSVTPQPKTGHWIEQIDYEENCRTLICSNCDRPALHDEDSIWKHKFCPHCGAKMIEPQEREE